jgi:hypothetical protein
MHDRYGPGTYGTMRQDEVDFQKRFNMSKEQYMTTMDTPISRILGGLRFVHDQTINRFKVVFEHRLIRYCYFTRQLGYALGFEEEKDIYNGEIAKHPPDLGGGVHHLYVYANGLIENMIVGDSMAALQRIVTISGEKDKAVEQIFDSPIMSRVVNHEISDIDIEIRTADGRYFPFEWVNVHLVLVFKKALYL